jgi:hypothetical protein
MSQGITGGSIGGLSSHPIGQITFDLKAFKTGGIGLAVMNNFTGLQRTQIAAAVRQIFSSIPWAPKVLEYLKMLARMWVPVRTGHLADYIIQTMRITEDKGYGNSYVFTFTFDFEVPPEVLKYWWHFKSNNTVMHSMKLGVGDYPVALLNPIPNVYVIANFGTGRALYLLNDPTARTDYAQALVTQGEDLMDDEVNGVFVYVIIRASGGRGDPYANIPVPDLYADAMANYYGV